MTQLNEYGNPRLDDKGKPKNKLRSYKCAFCQFQFKHWVGTSRGNKPVSTQIICPKCQNFIKTH